MHYVYKLRRKLISIEFDLLARSVFELPVINCVVPLYPPL